MALPTHAKYVVIGAGIHGLSTAWHLAEKLRKQGRGSGSDILVLDKTRIGAGASGIACGVVRNNYFQPAMRQLMAHSVTVWESDPEAFSYHSVGYMQISPEVMHADVASIAGQQRDIGYDSTFIEGEADSAQYMKGLFHDWQAKGITSVLHEKRGGYANNMKSVRGLASKAENENVRIATGIKVTGFEKDASGAVKTVITDQGRIDCDFVVVGVGPWVKQIWDMLELPAGISIKGRDGKMHEDVPMWVYWSLQEGTSVFELRGGTHLILLAKQEIVAGDASFDLMVEDLRATHQDFTTLGLAPTPIEAVPAIDHELFRVREPAGHLITFYSNHVSGPV